MIIDKLNALCTLLGDAPLSMNALAAELGTVTDTYKYNLAVSPSDAEFKAANVVRRFESDDTAHVDLTLSEPLSLNALVSAFGDYDEVPPMPGEPEQVIFYVRRAGKPHQVALIASTHGGYVQSVTLRRD